MFSYTMFSYNKNFVEDQLRSEISCEFAPEAMKVAVDAKKKSRGQKGLHFNCIVIKRYTMDGDELGDFLNFLKSPQQRFPDNSRFQILYWNKPHWSVIDVLLHQGEFQFYLLDAAGSPDTSIHTLDKIHIAFPKSIIRFSAGGIQFDQENCGTFSLDHAWCLSKIPTLHEDLSGLNSCDPLEFFKDCSFEDMRSTFILKKGSLAQNVKYIPLENFPVHFGPLLRNMQSYSSLESTHFPKKMKANAKESLRYYVSKRVVLDDDPKQGKNPKYLNDAVNLKRKKFKTKALSHLKKLGEEGFKAMVEEKKDYSTSFNFKDNKENPLVLPEEKPLPKQQPKIEDEGVEEIASQLILYIKTRKWEARKNNSQYHGFWGRLSGMSSTIKLSAADKLLKLIEKTSNWEIFSDAELDALRECRLGKIVFSAEKIGLLPKAFANAENYKVMRNRRTLI